MLGESQQEYQQMKDVRGKNIKIGDIVTYPVRRRSTMVLKTATVAEIDKTVVCLTATGRRVELRHSDRCAVVES